MYWRKSLIYDAACHLTLTYPNWWNKINTERLDILSIEDCIIGQLNGEYDIQLDYPEAYRVCRKNSKPFNITTDRRYRLLNKILTKIWVNVILEMRQREKSIAELVPIIDKVFGTTK